MELFLLRHAEAEERHPDAGRALTPNGRQTIRDLAAFLSTRQFKLDITAVWHSPLLRARETAELFCQSAGIDAPLSETAGLRPMDAPVVIAKQLHAASGKLLVVGHNPHLETLTAILLGLAANTCPVNVPKAAFLRFRRYDTGKQAQWQLRDLITTRISASI